MARAYIQHQYPLVTAELVRVQRELTELMVASADPLVERRTRNRRETLEKRRAELLDSFGRLGLGWLMEGGSVELLAPPSAAPPSATPPAPSEAVAPDAPAADPADRLQ